MHLKATLIAKGSRKKERKHDHLYLHFRRALPIETGAAKLFPHFTSHIIL